jgi:hypothetical protein
VGSLCAANCFCWWACSGAVAAFGGGSDPRRRLRRLRSVSEAAVGAGSGSGTSNKERSRTLCLVAIRTGERCRVECSKRAYGHRRKDVFTNDGLLSPNARIRAKACGTLQSSRRQMLASAGRALDGLDMPARQTLPDVKRLLSRPACTSVPKGTARLAKATRDTAN